MTFRRTSNGLSNQHLFYQADALVFIEGGKSLTKEQAYNGDFNENEIEIKYWKGIFSIFKSDIDFEFRSIGSKTTLENISNDIISGDIRNVYVAMDKDYDCIKNKIINHPYILYTHGYSWENDVWQPEVVCEVYNSLTVALKNKEDTKTKILSEYNSFIENIHLAVVADAYFCKMEKSVIPRKQPLCCLNLSKNVKPTVNCDKIDELLNDFEFEKSNLDIFEQEHTIDSRSFCYGHLLSDYCYHLITYFLSNIRKKTPSIAKHFISLIGIDKFLMLFTKKKFLHIYTHFQTRFA